MIQAPADLLDFHPTLRRIRNEGACRETEEPDDFFANPTEPVVRYVINTYCRRCPVQLACLQWALDQREVGTWGGMTDEQRRQMRNGRA